MKHKVDISEVIEFSDELKTASEDIKSSLKKVEENIEQINAMESFSGKAAKEAKGYFNDLHKTILESFNGLFTDLDNNLKKHLESFQLSVDRNESAIIESDYLKDTEEDISDDYEKLSEEQESIRETISSVSDISSANHPISWTLDSDKDDATKIITKLEEKLDSFTRKEDDSQTKELLHQIEVAMKNAKTNDGTARFTDYKGNSKNVGLPELKDYNQGKKEEEIAKAKEAKDDTIKDLNEPSQEILNKAYTDLQNGKIDETQYYNYLTELKGMQSGENSVKEVSKGFLDYLNENVKEIHDLAGVNTIGAYVEKGVTEHGKKVLSESVERAGKAVGGVFMGANVALGMYDDLNNNDKTPGQAVTHNAAVIGTGIVGDAVATGAVVVGAAILGTTPAGWAIAAGIAGATVATWGFNYLYNNNKWGIQDTLDRAGEKVDELTDGISDFKNDVIEGASNMMDSAGEALSSGFDFVNPFS